MLQVAVPGHSRTAAIPTSPLKKICTVLLSIELLSIELLSTELLSTELVDTKPHGQQWV